jgi:hypothetical protein
VRKEVSELYSSGDIIRVITLRMMAWEGPVALMGKTRSTYGLLVRKT